MAIQTTVIEIGPDQVKTLFSLPINAIPAPAAGTCNMILGASCYKDVSTVAFATMSYIALAGVLPVAVGFYIDDNVIFSLPACMNAMTGWNSNSKPFAVVTDVFITTDADSAIGDGTIFIYITWENKPLS